MARTKPKKSKSRRFFFEEFKQEAVQMLLDGHSAPSVAERLGLSGPNAYAQWRLSCGARVSHCKRGEYNDY